MIQYACETGKIPITFRDFVDPESNINELFLNKPNIALQFSDLNLLNSKIDDYLNNSDILKKDSLKLKDAVISKNQFNSNLSKYLSKPINSISVDEYDIDIKSFYLQYLKRFNDNKSSYYQLFITRNLKTFPFFLAYYLIFFLERLYKYFDKKPT